jgi:hypothetical protein
MNDGTWCASAIAANSVRISTAIALGPSRNIRAMQIPMRFSGYVPGVTVADMTSREFVEREQASAVSRKHRP